MNTNEVSVNELIEYLGEGFHTAFRKASDSPEATQIWDLISNMPAHEWHAILEFVAVPVLNLLGNHSQKDRT